MIGRMKFEIDALVDEILDRLPEEVWTSSTTTFLDPALGGGQFVRSIEARLRKAGHSDGSISQRVFGFEKSDLNIRYAVNKHELVGQYSHVSYDDLFEKGIDMKFDVVVGNPPYQKGKNHDFYVEFVKIAKDLSKNWIAFVTPNRLFVKGHKLCNEIQEVKLTNIWWDVSNYNNWGIKTFVSAWIAENKQHNSEEIVNDLDLVIRNGDDTICSNSEFAVNNISYNLLNKVYGKFPKMEFVKKKTGNHDLFIKRQWRRWNSITKCGGLHTFNPSTVEHDGKFVAAKDESQRSKIEFYLCESKLIRFITYAWAGGMNVPPVLWELIPKIDFDKSLNDKEVFELFGLNKEEIEYIESIIK